MSMVTHCPLEVKFKIVNYRDRPLYDPFMTETGDKGKRPETAGLAGTASQSRDAEGS